MLLVIWQAISFLDSVIVKIRSFVNKIRRVSAGSPTGREERKVKKVVFHIDEMSKWELLLNNVQNLLNVLGQDGVQTAVLANSEAVAFYESETSSEAFGRMRRLAGLGVSFLACSIALRGMKISPERLPDCVRIVPSGVVELVGLQERGYAYVKP